MNRLIDNRTNPTFVFCIGMKRSGSTLQYNLSKLLLENQFKTKNFGYVDGKDLSKKLSNEDKQSIETIVSNLEESNKGTDVQNIKTRLDELNTIMMEVSQKMYQDNQPQEPQPDVDNVEEAEFEEV